MLLHQEFLKKSTELKERSGRFWVPKMEKQKIFKYSVCINNMEINKRMAVAWMIGFFVFWYPFNYAMNGSLINGLLMGIFGLAGAILLLMFGDKI